MIKIEHILRIRLYYIKDLYIFYKLKELDDKINLIIIIIIIDIHEIFVQVRYPVAGP